ncbi:calcium/sodium antiporter [Tissierellaceae bacterium HCP3S3_D8]
MEIGLTILLFLLGLIMIIKGGDWFVDAAIWIADRTGISFGVIGATIISVATTLPEFFVSTIASNEGFSDMAIGNAVGSIICNIALIVALCVLIKPIRIKDNFFGIKGIMMLIYLCILFFLSLDRVITKSEGLFLISLTLIFLLINIIDNKGKNPNGRNNIKRPMKKHEFSLNGLKFIIGGFLIIFGAHLLVKTGVEIANFLRIPKQIISLTFLAVGTSLPELVTALTATFKNQQDISVGNILGANILNITIVIGGSALVSRNGLIIPSQAIKLDIPVAILVALLFIIPGIFKERIGRSMGIVLLSLYIIYLVILF